MGDVAGADAHGFGGRRGLGGGDRLGFLLAGEVGGGGRRAGDAAHAAGVVAAVAAGVVGEAVVDLLGGQAGIGGVEQQAFRHLEFGGGEQWVDGVIAGDVSAPEVAPLASGVVQGGAVHRLVRDQGAPRAARQAGHEVGSN
jgi:hypothetical protein